MSQAYERVFLVHGIRTPFAKFGGSLKDILPVDLAVHAAKALILKLNLDPAIVDQVILGNVIPSSTDTLYGGRHLALKLGCRQETPGIVINRLCGSGIEAILSAARLIKLKESNCVLVAGTENMSMTPHLTYGARFGTKYGALKSVDMLTDALHDQFIDTSMAITAENLALKFSIPREECDLFSYHSHLKASKAHTAGWLKEEIVPINFKKNICERDENIRSDVSLNEIQILRSTFKTDGVVTAATSSGIVDGAAAVLVAGESLVKSEGLNPIAEIIDGQVVGVDPKLMGIGPVSAIKNLLAKNNLSLDQIDLFEINEAFAAQVLACVKDIKLPAEKLNVWGGAVAFGHPLAASGVRITHTLARQLAHYDFNYGVASACIGGGQGIAVLLKRC